jgi:hypothetical protein
MRATSHRASSPAILAFALLLGCAASGTVTGSAGPTPVWVRSHNRSAVDVYLLCGNRDAVWLGEVSGRSATAFEMPAGQPSCIRGHNFFLVVRQSGRGYWAGPIRPGNGNLVELVIEKYAGLSSARVALGPDR